MQICMPGMSVEKDSSDSDPEAVAARKERKKNAALRQKEEEAREEAERKSRQEWHDSIRDKEQFFMALCPGPDFDVKKLMTDLDHVRPDGYEERLKKGVELHDMGKDQLRAEGGEENARNTLYCALHCLDFTPAEQGKEPMENRTRLLQTVAPVLQSLSLASSQLGDTVMASRAVDLGMNVLSKLPYKHSKDLRVKMRMRRANLRGETRDFKGAQEDAIHVLEIQKEHENALLVKKNAALAMMLEKGPKEKRWKGSLQKVLKQKPPPPSSLSSKPVMVAVAASVVVIVAVAVHFLLKH